MRALLIATALAAASALCVASAEAEPKQKRVLTQKIAKQKAPATRQQRSDNQGDPDINIRHQLRREPGNAVD